MSAWKTGTPKKKGWYLRDYRAMQIATGYSGPPYSVDLWDSGDWYVYDDKCGTNDAVYQDLPWKTIK